MLLNVKHLVLGETGDSNESPSWVVRRKIDRNRGGQSGQGPKTLDFREKCESGAVTGLGA